MVFWYGSLWALVALLWCVRAMPSLSSYANQEVLLAGTYYLFWSVNESSKSIQVALRARTSGWIGIGISEIGAMVGSDVIIGWVAKGKTVITDRFAFNKSLDTSGVALDKQQDVRIMAGQETYNGSTGDVWTTLHFGRKLDTGDCNDHPIMPGEHVDLIWAMGSTDAVGYHGLSRGEISLILRPGQLFPGQGPSPKVLSMESTQKRRAGRVHRLRPYNRRQVLGVSPGGWINLTAPAFKVPAIYTNYICNTFHLRLTRKHHAIEMGPVLNGTETRMMHHILVMGCTEGATLPETPNWGCLNWYDPKCATIVGSWAYGGRGYQFVPQAGLPFGPGGYKTLVVQIHYNNPGMLAGAVDSSGIYYRVTSSLRKYDAGVLLVGPSAWSLLIRIPPREPSWTQDSVCPAACTNAIINNVTIVASMNHAHLAARQMYTDLYRGGKRLFTVNRQDYFDFAFQQYKDLSPGINIQPGDELRTRCVWDTSKRTAVTVGGPAATDEMCTNFFIYYPARKDFGYGCFDMCLPIPSTNLGAAFYYCSNDIILPLTQPCTPYGQPALLKRTVGCANSLLSSLSQLPRNVTTVPANPGKGVGPTTACRALTPHQLYEGYKNCMNLPGGFSIMWNCSAPSNSANATATVLFQGASVGYIAFGLSPTGHMLLSSAFAAWAPALPTAAPTVVPLFLGGRTADKITVGNSLKLLSSSATVSSKGAISIRVTLSVPQKMAAANQTLVYSKGAVVSNFITQHNAFDAHVASILLLGSGPAG